MRKLLAALGLCAMVALGTACTELGGGSTSQGITTTYNDAIVTSHWAEGLEVDTTLSDRRTGTAYRAVYVPNPYEANTWDLVMIDATPTTDHGEIVLSIEVEDFTLESANAYFYSHCRANELL